MRTSSSCSRAEEGSLAESTLESKARSLVRIAALAAIDATTPSYLEAVDSAREGGASDDEIVGVLIAIIPAVGVPRVVSAAPKLALAIGYDVGAALERYDR